MKELFYESFKATAKYLGIILLFVLAGRSVLDIVAKRTAVHKPIHVAIIGSDTFSTESGKWRMDTFINYTQRRLDTSFYFHKIQ